MVADPRDETMTPIGSQRWCANHRARTSRFTTRLDTTSQNNCYDAPLTLSSLSIRQQQMGSNQECDTVLVASCPESNTTRSLET
jgi:hypothetical protein